MSKPKPKEIVEMVPMDRIRTEGLQMRAKRNEDAIAEYEAVYREKPDDMPPGRAVRDAEGLCWLWDGHHRKEGAERAGLQELPLVITEGTRRDAVLLACGANATHGIQRTPEDKRRAVQTLFDDTEWNAKSEIELARMAGVSKGLIWRMREQGLATSRAGGSQREGRDGSLRAATAKAAEATRQRIADLLRANSNRSNNDISKEIGCSHHTVESVRAEIAIAAMQAEAETVQSPVVETEPEADDSDAPVDANAPINANANEDDGCTEPDEPNPEFLAPPDEEIVEAGKAKPVLVVTDELGLPVPSGLLEVFSERALFDDIAEKLKSLQKQVHAAAVAKSGWRYCKNLSHNSTKAGMKHTCEHIANAIRKVRFGRPYAAFCPYCLAKPKPSCSACAGQGWIGELEWDRVPDEEKAKAMAFTKGRVAS